ncbi:MAG TPA: sugar ABC transporter substrate-binding protein [Chloroflexota bacterium]
MLTTRRQLLKLTSALGGLVLLQACGQAAAPTAAPTAAPAAKPAEAPKPTEAPKPAAAAPTNTPAAAAAAATKPAAVEPTKPAAAAAPTTAPAAAKPATGPAQEGTLRLLTTHGAVQQPVIKASLDRFKQKYPKITVQHEDITEGYYDKLNTQVASGTLPDVVNLRTFDMYDWYRKKSLLDLTPYINADGEFDVKKIVKPILDSCYHEGKYWGMPYDASVVVLFYNKDMFDKAGVKYPDASWTWDKVNEAAKAMTSGSGATATFGLASPPPMNSWLFEPFLHQAGGRFANKERTAFATDTPEATAAIQWVADLVLKNKVAPTPEQGTAINLFNVGRGGMVFNGQWNIPGFREALKFNWDVAALPGGPKGKAQITHGGTYIGYGKTKVPDLSWTMIKWIAGPDWQRNVYGLSGYSVPSLTTEANAFIEPSQQGKPPKNAEVVLSELQTAETGELWPDYWKALQIWTDEANLVLLGKKEPAQAGKDAKQKADGVIKEALSG